MLFFLLEIKCSGKQPDVLQWFLRYNKKYCQEVALSTVVVKHTLLKRYCCPVILFKIKKTDLLWFPIVRTCVYTLVVSHYKNLTDQSKQTRQIFEVTNESFHSDWLWLCGFYFEVRRRKCSPQSPPLCFRCSEVVVVFSQVCPMSSLHLESLRVRWADRQSPRTSPDTCWTWTRTKTWRFSAR